MDWYAAESTAEEKPRELDITSSPELVYKRRNIQQKVQENGEGETQTKWVYEECTQTKEEYETQQAELTSPVTEMIMQEMAEIELAQAETQIALELMAAG